MSITFDNKEVPTYASATCAKCYETSFKVSQQDYDVKNYGEVRIVEFLPPQSFFTALDDLNNGRLIDLNIALEKPSPNE
jgi:hypothetical protein